MVARELRSRVRPNGAAEAPAPGQAAGASPARRAAAAAERRQRAERAAERAREVEDSPRVLRDKCRRLARALRNAKHLVVYTGAGISTAADIPDYRGPRGVWTRLRRGERVPRVDAAAAEPTFTHMALAALCERGTLKFLVSQNCDGLHVRAGTPRRALAELHGDMFAERCAACRRVYLRAFDTTERTARHRHGTCRLCHGCGGELTDTIVHFGERGRAAWPLNWAGALRHAARADVVLCLGSSLKVLRRYPRLWRMQSAPQARPRLYIVNLQWTPKDSVAALKINARCDDVMRAVARRLRLRVPRYRRARDPLLAHAEPLAPPEAHTTRRAPLSAAAPPRARRSPDLEELGSPSASDSDEELPLRRLADRLRRAERPPAAAPAPLRAFRVAMQCGEATILLRAEHAPPEPAPAAAARRLTAELRRARPPPRRAAPAHGSLERDCKLRRLLERAPDLDLDLRPKLEPAWEPKLEPDWEPARVPKLEPKLGPEWEPTRGTKSEPKLGLEREPVRLPKSETKLEPERDPARFPRSESKHEPERAAARAPKSEPRAEAPRAPSPASSSSSSGSEGGAGSLAAAIIARAVLLCRGELYPGLHTILAGAGAGAGEAGAECAWCWRARGARRCLWYGPARLTPLQARAWRGGRARPLLCACCGAEGGAAPALDDTGGWYGKGYRKGRRRRR